MITKKNIILQSKHGRPFLADVFCEENNSQKPVVILTHGFQGFKDWGAYDLMAKKFAQEGFVFVKHNMSHDGTTVDQPTEFADTEAFGHNNFSIELDDLGVVIDWVYSEDFPINKSEVDIDQIYLIGHSRGGGIAMLKAGEDTRIKKVSPWASVNEFGKYWKSGQMKKIKEEGVIYVTNSRTQQQLPVYAQLYDNYFDNLKRLFIPNAVRSMGIPMIIIHGTKDETVPYHSAIELKEWKPDAELVLIEDANHVFGSRHPWTEYLMPEHLNKAVSETVRFFKLH